MTNQDTMRLALEALETHVPHYLKDRGYAPIEALRSALSQQSPISDVTEAVTRTVIDVEKLLCEKLGKQWKPSGMSIQTLVDELAQQGEQQPVAWGMPRSDGLILDIITPEEHESYEGGYTVPLYAAAPAAQPLSIEEVEQINAQWNYEIHGDRTRYIARMVEQAHGIGVQK